MISNRVRRAMKLAIAKILTLMASLGKSAAAHASNWRLAFIDIGPVNSIK